MSAHTPAPWETCGVRCKVDGQPFLQVNGPNGYVALIPYSDRKPADHLQSHADQRLIAAAPDLLAVVKAFMGGDDRFRIGVGGNPIAVNEFLDHARVVIAKAEGEA